MGLSLRNIAFIVENLEALRNIHINFSKVFTTKEFAVPKSIPIEEFRMLRRQKDYMKQQPNVPKMEKKKDAVAYKSFDSLLEIGNEKSGGSTATQRCLSQPQVVSSNKVTLEGACSCHLIPVDSTAGPIPTALGINYSVSKLPLNVSLSTDQLNVPAIRTIYEHIPDPMLQSSPLLENKQLLKHQHSVRAEFKVPLPNPEIKVEAGMKQPFNLSGKTAAILTGDKGAEKTIIEIRRPLSYPESNSKQTNIQKAVAVSSFRSGSSPPQSTQLFSQYGAVVTTQSIDCVQQQEQSGNITRDQNQNRTRLISGRNHEQNKVILKKNTTKQKKDKIGDQNGGFFHQLTPTTSNKRRETQLEQEYDYFGTASSSSSNSSKHLQRHNYESNSREHESSSILATLAANGNVTSTGTAVVPESIVSKPRTILTIPPPEPPVDYYENVSDNSSDKKSLNLEQKISAIKKSVGNGTKVINTGASIVGSRHSPHRQTVTKKTRVYVVDGVQMTSTSHQVFGVKQDYELSHIPRYYVSLYGNWKQQLHELRRLQREEARQQRELNAKAEALRNEQIKRFAADKE
ncbi:unnamed protein product, partial [Onchocerca ochengi]|uniref:Uncharacterized protein n=1 Tax=Onchocerca ochengi TaxID=42157 RepID=A0A182EL11_ONCOC